MCGRGGERIALLGHHRRHCPGLSAVPARGACLLDGDVPRCWRLANGAPLPVPDLRFVELRATQSGTCGLSEEGEWSCWEHARDENGEVDFGPIRLRAIYPGPSQWCGIDESVEAVCWFGGSEPPKGGAWLDVARHNNEVCALHEDGSVYCEGRRSGQIGGAPAVRLFDDNALCALRADDTVECLRGPGCAPPWAGARVEEIATYPGGQCCYTPADAGDTVCGLEPLQDPGVRLSHLELSGPGHLHGLDPLGRAWPNSPVGGEPETAYLDLAVDVPVRPRNDLRHFAVRAEDGALVHSWLPEFVPRGPFARLVTGAPCALRADGTWDCVAGWNQTWASISPGAPAGRFVELVAGQETWCGIRADGELRCWGRYER